MKEYSVLGISFSRQAIQAITDSRTRPTSTTSSRRSCARDPDRPRPDKLSPEPRARITFAQSLIRSVAYDMLSKAERRARHLRTAAHLRPFLPDEGAEVAEVIAAHLHDAYLTASDDADADELRSGSATDAYVAAAERAESVGAPEGAEAAYVMAAKLSLDEREQADLTERAGRSADLAGLRQRAVGHFEATIAAHSAAGRAIDAARVTSRLGGVLNSLGRGERAVVLLREALDSLPEGAAAPTVEADLQAWLGTALLFSGHSTEATEPIERALTLSQHYELPETLSRALSSRAVLLLWLGRPEGRG